MGESTRWGKMKCSGCGKEKPTNPKAREARLKKFGSEEKMLAKWRCRKCEKLAKEPVALENDGPLEEVAEDPKIEVFVEETTEETQEEVF